MPFSRPLFLAVLLLLTACTPAKGPFRTTALSDPTCATPIALENANQERGQALATRYRCSMQQHLLPSAARSRAALAEALAEQQALETAPGAPQRLFLPANDWTTRIPEGQPALLQSDDYYLAFVELADNGSRDVAWQMPALREHLAAQRAKGRQNYVVTFVHGWRHNAELRDGDVRKLRRMLAYSRAALNSRCVALGEYCNTTLTGVFIGWNGQKIKEGPSDENPDQGMGQGLSALGPALTFWDRWNVSCKLGSGRRDCVGEVPQGFKSPLGSALSEIEDDLRLRPGDPRADKFLIFGHSMGGNMLATLLRDKAVAQVKTHKPGRAMRPLMGDLVVLLNPAARAQDWTAIQRAERALAGLGDSRILTCQRADGSRDPDCDLAALLLWHRLYPVEQRPVYVSLTSAADWGTLRQKDRDVQHDTATGQIFPFAREFVGEKGPEKVTAIGHRTPNYASRFTLNDDPVGTSHEIAVLEGAQTDGGQRYTSRYGNAVKPEAGWCEPADGWLYRARVPQGTAPGRYQTNWDYGYVPVAPGAPPVSSRNIGGDQNKAAVQWRQGLYLKTNTGALSVSPGTSPFWNARALDSAIRGHAGWANYATWCALNQLVLDDVTAAQPESLPPGEIEALTRRAVIATTPNE
ncbi:hypothetical protein [Rhodalgimonas zhirmunskyi]|uniref:Alpha/beta hydrolase family protein n=1 Tax=Rhodalgimonas zhirmunskyi TaxID=2964767 RepID=A0AAJ1UB35_9RHOB|nr:hypothetical protein [Rhodoalgimonas zhirmunskyi]MDQ2093296.1 hypothetical protein [Rhodoalgimonas zhirmunskyi]